MGNWKTFFKLQEAQEYFTILQNFIDEERKTKTIFPEKKEVFNAFLQCSLSNTKVVILGQDPYHGENQAHGLSFSVKKAVKTPPSLRNIFKELHSDLSITIPKDGDLSSWAQQGVMLLNASLTVEEAKAGSHLKKGWETFTDAAIEYISEQCENVVFLLWGRFAQNKKPLIDKTKHLILEAAHPSPLSAYNGFFGSNHFSRANFYLQQHGRTEIDWNSINKQEMKLDEIASLDDELLINLFTGSIPTLCPTDTVWGLHTHYKNKKGISRIETLKQRDETKRCIVITDTLKKVDNLSLNEKSIRFINEASKLGAVTFRVSLENEETIAIRIPQNKWLKDMLTRLPFPLLSTSANISNSPIPNTKVELFELFENSVNILDDGSCDTETISSTILDLSKKNCITLLREGRVTFQTLEQLWQSI